MKDTPEEPRSSTDFTFAEPDETRFVRSFAAFFAGTGMVIADVSIDFSAVVVFADNKAIERIENNMRRFEQMWCFDRNELKELFLVFDLFLIFDFHKKQKSESWFFFFCGEITLFFFVQTILLCGVVVVGGTTKRVVNNANFTTSTTIVSIQSHILGKKTTTRRSVTFFPSSKKLRKKDI